MGVENQARFPMRIIEVLKKVVFPAKETGVGFDTRIAKAVEKHLRSTIKQEKENIKRGNNDNGIYGSPLVSNLQPANF